MRICLIGKNLTNIVLANVLAEKKINIDIIYNLDIPKNDSLRTLAISKNNYNFLKNINKNIKIPIWPTKKIKIFVENLISKELIEFTNEEKNIFFLVKYAQLYGSFFKSSKKNKYINFIKLKKINSEILLKNNKYNFIINSDPNNNITKKFFYKKIKKNYNSLAFTGIITHKKIKNNVATQIFTKSGPLAFLPLSNTKTSIVYSFSGINKNDDQIRNIIEKLNINYQIKNFSKFEKFYIKFSMLKNYYYKNILSFGDLLHRVHPLAGQGFNMTLRDIKILSKLIDQNSDLGLELNSSILESFEKKTKHLNYIYGAGIDFVYEFFNFDNKINNLLSKNIFKLLKNKNFNKYATYIADKGLSN